MNVSADLRIIIEELRVEIDAPLVAAEAERVGAALRRALCRRLEAVQETRLARHLRGDAVRGPARVPCLSVRVRGDEACVAAAPRVAARIVRALERRIDA